MVTIRPQARLVGEPKKTKKKGRKEGRKKDTRNSGELAIRPDDPHRRIKIKLCMVGGLRCVVLHVKCDPKRLRGYGAVGVENGPSPLLWPVAYTTACTTVQAVMRQPDSKFQYIQYLIFACLYPTFGEVGYKEFFPSLRSRILFCTPP